MMAAQAAKAVADGATVRLRYADGTTHAVGKAIAYTIVPAIVIELPDGTRQSWREDMADVVQDADPSP